MSKGIAAGEVLWQSDTPVNLGQDEASSLNHSIPPLKVAGKYFLQASLISPAGQTLARNEYPFYLVDGDIWVVFSPDKNIYRPGETVTIEGRVESLVEVDSSGLALDINETEPENLPLFSEVFDLPAYTMHNFSFTTIAEAEGRHELSAVVLQNGTALAEFSAQYETASPVVVAALEAPDTVGSESFPLSLTLNNTEKVHATIDVQIVDGSGGTVDAQVVEIPAGETKVFQHSLKIVGTTTYTAQLSRDLTQTLTKQVVYRPPTLDSDLTVKVVTDQASYDSNEVATLIATMTANSSQENLSARISVSNSQGQIVYADNAILPTFVQGQTIAIDNEWNVGNVLAGTYLVSLKVIDDKEVVVANPVAIW